MSVTQTVDKPTYRAVWTCNNSSISADDEHVLAEIETDSLETLAADYTIHYHGNCLDCEAENAYHEGSLDRVEVIVDDEMTEIVSPQTLVTKYGMDDEYHECDD